MEPTVPVDAVPATEPAQQPTPPTEPALSRSSVWQDVAWFLQAE